MNILVAAIFLTFCSTVQTQNQRDLCQLTINGQTAADLCKHGQCIDMENGTECICDLGYGGPRCEEQTQPDYCSMTFAGAPARDLCPPGTLCTNTREGTICECFSYALASKHDCKNENNKSVILLLGGVDITNQNELNSTQFYDLTQGEIEIPGAALTLPMGMYDHGVALQSDGTLLVASGVTSPEDYRSKDRLLYSSSIYDFTRKEWRDGPNLTYAHNSGAWTVYDGKLTICGGTGEEKLLTPVCEQLQEDTWVPLEPTTRARTGASAVSVNNMLCLLGGGYGVNNSDASEAEPEKSIECFNGVEWSSLPDMSLPRRRAATVVVDDEIVVCGGIMCSSKDFHMNDPNRTCITNQCEKYSFESNSWHTFAPMRNPRASFQLVHFKGTLLAIGGYDTSYADHYNFLHFERFHLELLRTPTSVEQYGIDGEWREIEALTEGRFAFAAVVL